MKVLSFLLLLLPILSSAQNFGPAITVDGTVNTDQATSMQIINNQPAIAYYDRTDGDLKFVRAANTSGSAWSVAQKIDSVGNVGWFVSMAIVNGNPAISYYDRSNRSLKFVRALDANGTSWGTPQTILAGGSSAQTEVGLYTSLQVVNGNPAIAYLNLAGQKLSFIRATDVNGTTWGQPVDLERVGMSPYISMVVVNGNPAIGFFSQIGGATKYIRANDSNGSAWPLVSQTIDASGGPYTSMAVVNGNPAISYSDGNTIKLKYIRATNNMGSSWGSPITINNETTDAGMLAVIGGKPMISYVGSNIPRSIKLIAATDIDGSVWGTAQTASIDANAMISTSLIDINNSPAIAYP